MLTESRSSTKLDAELNVSVVVPPLFSSSGAKIQCRQHEFGGNIGFWGLETINFYG